MVQPLVTAKKRRTITPILQSNGTRNSTSGLHDALTSSCTSTKVDLDELASGSQQNKKKEDHSSFIPISNQSTTSNMQSDSSTSTTIKTAPLCRAKRVLDPARPFSTRDYETLVRLLKRATLQVLKSEQLQMSSSSAQISQPETHSYTFTLITTGPYNFSSQEYFSLPAQVKPVRLNGLFINSKTPCLFPTWTTSEDSFKTSTTESCSTTCLSPTFQEPPASTSSIGICNDQSTLDTPTPLSRPRLERSSPRTSRSPNASLTTSLEQSETGSQRYTASNQERPVSPFQALLEAVHQEMDLEETHPLTRGKAFHPRMVAPTSPRSSPTAKTLKRQREPENQPGDWTLTHC